MKRIGDAYIARAVDIVFQPALAPMEAAMLPASAELSMPRARGALAHVKASFAPGKPRGGQTGYRLKLRTWGAQRQKI